MTWPSRLHGAMNIHDDQQPTAVLLTVGEAARRMSIGRTWLYERVLSGEIPSVKLGRARRIPAAALEEFVHRMTEGA